MLAVEPTSFGAARSSASGAGSDAGAADVSISMLTLDNLALATWLERRNAGATAGKRSGDKG